jgi:SAM-dependent methyltransferase
VLEGLKRYSDRLRGGPFRASLLLNPFYVLPRLRSIGSWDEFLGRLDSFKLYLLIRWRDLWREDGPDPALVAELTAHSAREDALRRWANGEGLDIGGGARSSLPGRAETLDFDPRWRDRIDIFAPCDHIPVEDGRYDFIVASHILEHLPNPIAALAEWSRVLRKDGTLILFLPDCRLFISDRLRFDAGVPIVSPKVLARSYRRGEPNVVDENIRSRGRLNAAHHHLWRLNTLRGLLESLGFEVLHTAEATEAFVHEFESRLLPRYTHRRFIEVSESEPFNIDIRTLQYRLGEPILDYSFIIVVKNPERSKINFTLNKLNDESA